MIIGSVKTEPVDLILALSTKSNPQKRFPHMHIFIYALDQINFTTNHSAKMNFTICRPIQSIKIVPFCEGYIIIDKWFCYINMLRYYF